uniref:Uncharacterized protein n=1 Tax=Fagus sylvatica TaxID=28930 RepID=A0A2N9HX46_FAGSY
MTRWSICLVSSSFGAAAEEIEDEDAEIDAVETVSEAETVAAEVNSADESTTSGAFSGGEGMVAEAIRLSSIERIVDGHTTVGVVTSAMRAVETTPITITSSGGTAQGGLSGSGSHVDPSLLDSSPSTRQYVRRARRGSLVSTDSERTASVTQLFRKVRLHQQLLEKFLAVKEVSVHIPEVPEGNIFVESISIDENLVIDVDFNADMAHVEPAEVAASEEPVQADVTPDSGVPIIEEELAQGPVDDVDMADTHDSYDEVWADAEDNMAGAQAADMEVTAPVAAQTSPTKTAGSGSETIAEEERRLQTAAMESAIRGQPGLLSAARSATLGSSVLADMDAFFREFDRTSFSSRHAEHFWTFDDVKADFEIFRVPRGGIRFLKALWEKLEDITEVHILEWKAVVQEAIEGGFKFGFILDYLRRLAHDMFSRRILAELRVAEARVAALRDALDMVALDPWDLASARRVPAEAHAESALQACCLEHIILCIPLSFLFCTGSDNEAVAEEERRHQTAAVESASRGQLGLLSVAKSATLGSSVLAEMDAFFREFDRMSVSSRHAEYFWIFDDVKVEFHGFRVPQGGVRFLEALWKKYGSCSAYLKLGVYIKGFMLTLLCLKRIVAGVTAAAYGVVAEAADDVVVKVADEVIAEIVENASNMQEVPAVNDVIVLGIIPKQDSQNRRGDSPQDRDYDPEGDDLAFVIRKCFLDSPVVLFPFLFEQVCYVRHCHKASFSLSCLIASASSLWFCCKLCISSSSRFVGGASGFGSLGGGGGGFCALTADSAWECSMWAETSLCFLLCRGLGGMALELYLSSWKC